MAKINNINPLTFQSENSKIRTVKKGEIVAYRIKGVKYYNGEDFIQNKEKAVEYFIKAADLNDTIAMLYLWYCYYKGEGVTQDSNKAIEYLTKAAMHDNSTKDYILWYCTRKCGMNEPSLKEAVEHFTKAAEQGDETTINILKTPIFAKDDRESYGADIKQNNVYTSYNKNNKKIHYNITAGKFLIITPLEVDDFMVTNRFINEDQESVKKIKKEYNDADIIFYFLNLSKSNYHLVSFMPIYYENTFYGAPLPNDINGVICNKPIKINIAVKNWRREHVEKIIYPATRSAYWQGKFGFGLQEDNMPIAELDISPAIGKPVKQVHIDFMYEQLDAYKKKAAERPEFKHCVHEIVREIEMMRRELDVQTGFTEAQIDTHYMALALPEINGKVSLEFDGGYLSRFWDFITTCINQILPGSGKDAILAPVAFAYSSTMLLLDIVPTNNEIQPKHEKKVEENVERVKKTIKEIVSASSELTGKGEYDDRLDRFLTKTKIEPEKASVIVDKLVKVFPSPKSKYNSIKILVPGEKEASVTLEKSKYLSFVGLNAQLKEQIKIPPKEELEGFLGAISVWDKNNPKFTIKTIDKKRPTIHYSRSDRNDKMVANSIGKYIKVRVSYDGKKIFLIEWL